MIQIFIPGFDDLQDFDESAFTFNELDSEDSINESIGSEIWKKIKAAFHAIRKWWHRSTLDTILKVCSRHKAIYFLTIEKRTISSAEYNRIVSSFTKSIYEAKTTLTSKLEDTRK